MSAMNIAECLETPRLLIQNVMPIVSAQEEADFFNAHPGLREQIEELDPLVGASLNPIFFSIYVQLAHRFIGMCCLYNLDTIYIEFGIRIINPEYWNKGYGSEVVNALCDYVFSHYPKVTCVCCKALAINTRAIRCYEKCGFQQYIRIPFDNYDMVFMTKRRALG